jgi:hypothetical protein
VEGRKKLVVAMGGLTKCEKFAQAVRGGKGGRRGRKKGQEGGERHWRRETKKNLLVMAPKICMARLRGKIEI